MVRRILTRLGLEGWQLGRSRAFLRAGQLATMEVRCVRCAVWVCSVSQGTAEGCARSSI